MRTTRHDRDGAMLPDLHHLAAAYTLDSLDRDEQSAFEAHHPDCYSCSAEVAEFLATAAVLAAGDSVPAPPELRSLVLARVSVTRQASPLVADGAAGSNRRFGRWIGPMLVAAALLLFGGTVYAVTTRDHGREVPAQAMAADVDDVLASPDNIVSTLHGGEGQVRVVWSEATNQAAVLGQGLPDPGPGLVYQLWFTLGEQALSPAGVFTTTDGHVEVAFAVGDLNGEGWGITIEPEGGSDEPTGEVLYRATI